MMLPYQRQATMPSLDDFFTQVKKACTVGTQKVGTFLSKRSIYICTPTPLKTLSLLHPHPHPSKNPNKPIRTNTPSACFPASNRVRWTNVLPCSRVSSQKARYVCQYLGPKRQARLAGKTNRTY